MKKLLVLFSIPIFSFGQIQLQPIVSLPDAIHESSGVIFYNKTLITHNDSGNNNQLIALDTISGKIVKTTTITNAINVDWEDITQDTDYIYIGDIGNNNGNRKDLKIYKVSKVDYLASDEVMATTISYNYKEQTSFIVAANNTDWDAEALFMFNDQLMVLTKQWKSKKTVAYAIPKETGTYTVAAVGIYNCKGLITGATYNKVNKRLYLTGYSSFLMPFIIKVEGLESDNVFAGIQEKIKPDNLGATQLEAITYIGNHRYLCTSEKLNTSFFTAEAMLFGFTESFEKEVEDSDDENDKGDGILIYQEEVGGNLKINTSNTDDIITKLRLFSVEGREIGVVFDAGIKNGTIDTSTLSTAIYFVIIAFENHSISKKVWVN